MILGGKRVGGLGILVIFYTKLPLVPFLVPLVHKTVYNVRGRGYNRILGCFPKGTVVGETNSIGGRKPLLKP